MSTSWQAPHAAMMRQLAMKLGAAFDPRRLAGHCDGVAITYHAVAHEPTEAGDEWSFRTEIEAELPDVRLVLDVRPHHERDAERVAKGEMVDVQTGDAEFDEMFLVEAAPSRVVVKLLDQDTRRFLMDVRRERGVRVERKGKVLQLGCGGRVDDLETALALVRGLARIAAHVEPVSKEVDALIAHEAMGGPYRPADGGTVDTSEAHAGEFEKLAALDKRRTASVNRAFIMMFLTLGMFLGGLALIAVSPPFGFSIAGAGVALYIGYALWTRYS